MTYKLAAWLCACLATTATVASTHKGGYTVRNGDNDWAIAHRLHISVRDLHEANPDTNWEAIQTGQHLALPRHSSSSTHTVSEHATRRTESGHGTYTVKEDDNDWVIAAKLGIKDETLRRLNPDVYWTRIHPGQKLHVPSSVASKPIHRIETRYARVNSDDVTLRRGPGVDHDMVTKVDEGTEARVLDREHGWYKLRFPKGTVAWVRGDFLSSVRHQSSERTYASGRRHSSSHHYASTRRHHGTPEVALAESEIAGSPAAVQRALAMRGVRYRTGGTSRGGVDCSGMTSKVYAELGIHIPRTAREQSGFGQRVDKSGLKKGDLVFFKTNRSSRVNHVGMYVGNGKFVHASSGAGRVQVNSLNDGYYSRRYAGARRVAKAKVASKKSEKKSESKD